MPSLNFAFDRSARRIDADGRLHVDRSHISKAAINPYYGKEIPGFEQLGLEPDRIYRLYRDPVELERAAPTFARLPILSEHVPVTVDSPRPELVVGVIGSEVAFDAPYLDADTCFWDSVAIAGIEEGRVRELSCAYRYVPIMEPGEVDGQPYDGRMTEIQGNHLALVEVGRAGSDVVVADQNPFPKVPDMQMTKLGKAIFEALRAASPVLAADSALPALVANARRKDFDKAGIKAKLIALDSTLDPQQLDNVIDALLDVEQEPKAMELAVGDESPTDKMRKLLAGKVEDAIIEEACALLGAPTASDESAGLESEKKLEAAMDAYGEKLRNEMRQTNEAQRDVRSVVGDVALDSAEEIYAFALDHMSVDHKGVNGVPALRALFKVASVKTSAPIPRIAVDSAAAAERFPGIARFRNA